MADIADVKYRKSEPFRLIWAKGGYNPRVSHKDAEAAHREARRLALAHPGKRFFVLTAEERVWTDPPSSGAPEPDDSDVIPDYRTLPMSRAWEVRARFHGTMTVRHQPPTFAEAHNAYRHELEKTDPRPDRVELVEVVESILAHEGAAERIDPWTSIEIPHHDRAPDGTPWRQRAGEFADVAMANGHELVWREGVMRAAAENLRLLDLPMNAKLQRIIALLEQQPPPLLTPDRPTAEQPGAAQPFEGQA